MMISSRRLQLHSTWNACDGLGCQARIADPYVSRTASTRPIQCLDKSCFEKSVPNRWYSYRGGELLRGMARGERFCGARGAAAGVA